MRSDIFSEDEVASKYAMPSSEADEANIASKYGSKKSKSLLEKAYGVGKAALMLPAEIASGAAQDLGEIANDPGNAIKNLYQGGRQEIQNGLLPLLKKGLSLGMRPASDLAKGLGVGGQFSEFDAAKIPSYAADQPEAAMTKTGGILAQMLPGEKVASGVEAGGRALLENLPKFLGKKTLTTLAPKAAAGAAASPIYDIDPETGALSNAAFHGAAQLGKVAGKGAKNWLSAGLMPKALESNFSDLYKTANKISNADSGNVIAHEYEKYKGKGGQKGLEGLAWDQSRGGAKELGAQGIKFDTQAYRNGLNDAKSKLMEEYSASPEAKTAVNEYISSKINNLKGVSTVSGETKRKVSSIEDAINERQQLNQDFKKLKSMTADTPIDIVAKREANGAIRDALLKAFDSTIGENIENPLMQKFGEDYQRANEITQHVKNTFENTVPASGKNLKSTTFINNHLNKHESADISSSYKDFIPSSTNRGIGKFNQLAKMLGGDSATGDVEAAKKVIIRNHFEKAVEDGDINTSKLYSKYNDLSEPQRDWLFTPEERVQFKLLKHAKNYKPGQLMHGGLSSLANPVNLIRTISNSLDSFSGNELGKHFGEKMIAHEIKKKVGPKGITDSLAAKLAKQLHGAGRSAFMANTAPGTTQLPDLDVRYEDMNQGAQ